MGVTPIRIDPITLVEIEVEMNAAKAMHRPLPVLNPVRCAALLTEEVLEVVKAALDGTREPVSAGQFDKAQFEIRCELRQVAGMAIMWIQELDKLQKPEIGIGIEMKGDGKK